MARRCARNFYYGFRLLPKPRRLALSAMYAFFRACDDISDGDSPTDLKAAGLHAWRTALRQHWAPDPDRPVGGDPPAHADPSQPPGGQADAGALAAVAASPLLPAFLDAVARFSIPPACFYDLLDGTLMDLDTTTYETFDALYQYCYRVASTVGLVCVHIFGFDGTRDALQMAEWCGIAFQLTNIMRDVEEDAQRDRIYLPQEDLRRFGLTSTDLHHATMDARFLSMMQFQADRARGFYERSQGLASHLTGGSRPALRAMVTIYRGLLDRMEREQFSVFGRRIRLSNAEKIRLLVLAWLGGTRC